MRKYLNKAKLLREAERRARREAKEKLDEARAAIGLGPAKIPRHYIPSAEEDEERHN